MTHEQRAQQFVDNLMHRTHLRFQHEAMAKDPASTGANGLPCPEQRGCRREIGNSERRAQVCQLSWFTGLRPNFYKAMFDTLQFMAK